MDHPIGTGPPGSPTPLTLRTLLGRKANTYAGADAALARRMLLAMWALSMLVVAVLEVFFSPTRALGDLGWIWVVGVYVIGFGILWVLADKRRELGYDAFFVIKLLAVALIAVVQYGAGGRVAPYHELYMFLLIGASLMHPPRRVLGFLAVVAAAMFAPCVYAPGHSEVGDVVTELLLWTVLSIVLLLLMRTIRAQRIDLRQQGDDARLLARVDSLTGLGNRRAFDEGLDAELARSLRAAAPLSLIVADLDGLKQINDHFGHMNGDDCLRRVAQALKGAVRRPDLCFRWGGDEFAILLTDADAAVGKTLARRVEEAVESSCRRPDGDPLTITCGYAVLDPAMSAAEAVALSDTALLELKARPRRGTPAPV
jgi:diguanylate cyclase (GGDEF)-like protein